MKTDEEAARLLWLLKHLSYQLTRKFLICTTSRLILSIYILGSGFKSTCSDWDRTEMLLQTHFHCESLIAHALRVLYVGCLFCIFVLYMSFLNVTVKCIFNSHRQKKWWNVLENYNVKFGGSFTEFHGWW